MAETDLLKYMMFLFQAIFWVGTFGVLAEYGAEKKVSKYSSVFAAVSIGVPTGVILKFKIIRSNQSYVFPIHLSEEIVPAAIFYATVTPVLMWFIVKKIIIDPMNEDRQNFEIEKTKRVNEERMAMKKREAHAAIDLMHHTYERIVYEETSREGLIIMNGTYGGVNFCTDALIDVTVPLQCLVKDGVLQLYKASKSELPGFYDPCVGEDKVLKIQYTYKSQSKLVVIKDTEPVRLPL